MDPDVLIRLALVVVLGLVIWLVLHRRALFVIVIRDGRPQVRRGKVAKNFLDDVRQICQDRHIQKGKIRGIRVGKRVLLAFSRQIPPTSQQSIRNAWCLHG